jgi:hypothetical protein
LNATLNHQIVVAEAALGRSLRLAARFDSGVGSKFWAAGVSKPRWRVWMADLRSVDRDDHCDDRRVQDEAEHGDPEVGVPLVRFRVTSQSRQHP